MKYLEHLGLENISKTINGTEFSGGRRLYGRVEIYSTKKIKEDKKHSKLIHSKLTSADMESQVFPIASTTSIPNQQTMSDSPPRDSTFAKKESPSPDIKKTQKMLVDLIQTLNAAQIDYDFSELSPDCFEIVNLEDATNRINSYLGDVAAKHPYFLSQLWKEIDSALSGTLSQCELYRLVDGAVDDDIDDGVTSSFHYFFCNKDLKRLCYFHCRTTSGFRNYGNYDFDEEGEDDHMDEESRRDSDEEEDDGDDAYGWN